MPEHMCRHRPVEAWESALQLVLESASQSELGWASAYR